MASPHWNYAMPMARSMSTTVTHFNSILACLISSVRMSCSLFQLTWCTRKIKYFQIIATFPIYTCTQVPAKSKLEDNNGTVWAAESLWHVETCRWERTGLNLWMQGLAWDAEFRKSSLLYKEIQVFECYAFHLASLSMESLSRDTHSNLLIELKSRNLFFNYFTCVFSKRWLGRRWCILVKIISQICLCIDTTALWWRNRTDFTSRKQWLEVGFGEQRTVKHLLVYTGKLWMQCWFQ